MIPFDGEKRVEVTHDSAPFRSLHVTRENAILGPRLRENRQRSPLVISRSAVVLKHVHGNSVEEIAQELDRSRLASGGLLQRGQHKLRESMAAS